MKCIAIDDEPRALEIIETFVKKTGFLELVATFRNPLDAIDFLTSHPVDLIFLDINMPDIYGTELVKVLKNKPLIIFTTAYSQYAVESYELDAIDYLLKPFEFDRFLKSVLKAREHFNLRHKGHHEQPVYNSPGSKYLQIKSGNETHQVKAVDIKYIEGLGNYVKIHLIDKKIVAYIGLKDMMDILPGNQFVRIHKSYIVGVHHIKSYESYQVKLDTHTIPIGKNYRKDFTEMMNKKTK